MITLSSAINDVGGPPKAAEILGMSVRNIYKMLAKGTLPRTEYTGETTYAECLAQASGGKFTAEQLLDAVKPKAA